MKRFPCLGSLKFVFRSDAEERAGKSLHPDCPLQEGELLVQYRHDMEHEGRENFPMPEQIKKWIMDSHYTSSRETLRALRTMVAQGSFPGIPLHLITPFNVSYWWTMALEKRIGTKGNPWLTALDYLQRAPKVKSLKFYADFFGGCTSSVF